MNGRTRYSVGQKWDGFSSRKRQRIRYERRTAKQMWLKETIDG